MSFDPCLFFAHLKFKALTKLVLSKYASESKPQDIEIHTERSKNCRQEDVLYPLIAQRREEKGVENFFSIYLFPLLINSCFGLVGLGGWDG